MDNNECSNIPANTSYAPCSKDITLQYVQAIYWNGRVYHSREELEKHMEVFNICNLDESKYQYPKEFLNTIKI